MQKKEKGGEIFANVRKEKGKVLYTRVKMLGKIQG